MIDIYEDIISFVVLLAAIGLVVGGVIIPLLAWEWGWLGITG